MQCNYLDCDANMKMWRCMHAQSCLNSESPFKKQQPFCLLPPVSMRGIEKLHPLCCLPADCPPSPPPPQVPPSVAGVLYKWTTNIGKGWRPRWFAIRGAVLAYCKIRRRSRTIRTPLPLCISRSAYRSIVDLFQCFLLKVSS
jgi:hypothetical protein